MTANLLAPQAVLPNERCQAKRKQCKQQQAKHFNRGAIDLDPLRREDTVRLKPSQVGKREWQKEIVRRRLNERSYEVETPHNIVRRNRVYLHLTREPLPSLTDEIPAALGFPLRCQWCLLLVLCRRTCRRQLVLEKLAHPRRFKEVGL